MEKNIIGIIGCGNMGGAIARGMAAVDAGMSEEVYLYDLDPDKASRLAEETGSRHGDILQMVRGSDILLIAVKPSDFASLAACIFPDIVDQTIVSVMAGVTTDEIASRLGKDIAVFRAMPNLAASLRQSVTCLALNDKAAKSGTIEKVRKIFSCIGDVAEVDEDMMDSVTALSGSGPAYLFSLAQAMMESAAAEGLGEEVSRQLVSGTLFGASMLLKNSALPAAELVKLVASKGGTTEAALSVFRNKGFNDIIKAAVQEARKRSAEMSKGGR